MGRIAEMQQFAEEKKKKRKVIILIIFVIIGIILGIFIHPTIGAIVGLTPLVVNAMLDVGKDVSIKDVDLSKKIKEELTPKVVKQYLPDAEYLPYIGIKEEIYKQAEYIENINNYESDNKITYNLKTDDGKACNLEFAEVSFDINSDKKQRFVGILGIMPLNKDIRSKIKINRVGSYDKDYCFKVNVTNEEFENVFDVMSPNKKLASQLLTEEFLNKIMEFYNTYRYKVDINIIRNNLYIRVQSGSIIVDSKEGQEIDRNVMEKRYVMIQSLIQLMKNINDNIDCI